MFSNVDDGRVARVGLSLIMGDNTLGRMYLPHQFTNVFTPSDIFNINNDRVSYVLTLVKIDDENPKILRLNLLKIDYKGDVFDGRRDNTFGL